MKLTIKSKIIFGFIIMAILVGYIAYVAISANNGAYRNIHHITEETAPLVDASMEVMLTATEAHLWIEEVMSGAEPPESMNNVLNKIDESEFFAKAILEGGKNEEGTFYPIKGEEEQKLVKELIGKIQFFRELSQQRYDAFISTGESSKELDDQFDEVFEELIEIADSVEGASQAKMKDAIQKADIAIKSRHRNIIISVLLTLVYTIFIIIFMIRSVNTPIRKFIAMIRGVAEGEADLTKRIQVSSEDELAEMAKWFNMFIERMQVMIQGIQGKMEEMMSKSEQVAKVMEQSNSSMESISKSVESISDSTQNNASITEEINASTEEMVSNTDVSFNEVNNLYADCESIIKLTEDGSRSIRKVAHINQDVIKATAEVQKSINDLKKSSEDINSIINIISGISDQTNLLALNASIEAARAGEHGKGFAVVAEEVRKLAEASRESTGQINSLIKEIQEKSVFAAESIEEAQNLIQNSVNESNDVNTQFSTISQVLGEMVNKIQAIFEATKAQNVSASEVANTMNEISSTTLLTASETQQITAEIEEQLSGFSIVKGNVDELNETIEYLREQVKLFTI